jgi:hypothetical protein
MAGRDDKIPSIKKLSGTENWPYWKTVMRQHFKAADLWSLIEETEACPGAPAPLAAQPDQQARDAHTAGTKAVKAWGLRRERILDVLYQTVDESQSNVIMKPDIDTPKKAWDALVNNFDRPSLSNKMQLIQRLVTIQQGELTIDQYFAQISDVQTRLASILEWKLENDILIGLILKGLQPQYEMLKTALITKGEVSLGELHEALRTKESEFAEKSGSNSALRISGSQQKNSSSPTYAKTNSGKKYNGGKGKRGGGKRSSEDTSYPEGSCYHCGRFGHFKSECPKLKNNSLHDERSEEKGGAGGASSFCALYGANLKGTDFVIDSGATMHMVSDATMLRDVKTFTEPQAVTLGDGHSCLAVGEGKMRLFCDTDGRSHTVNVDEVLLVPKLSGNFISVNAAAKKGNQFIFQSEGTVVKNSKDEVIAVGSWVNRTPISSASTVCRWNTKNERFHAVASAYGSLR